METPHLLFEIGFAFFHLGEIIQIAGIWFFRHSRRLGIVLYDGILNCQPIDRFSHPQTGMVCADADSPY